MTDAPDQAQRINSPCRMCGAQVRRLKPRGRSRTEFCSQECQRKWWVIAKQRGGQIYKLLIEWRTTRGTRKGVVGDMAAMIDGWISEDKAKRSRGDTA